MKAKDRPRFDIDALRDLAGAKVFGRGEAYHNDGRVVILSIEAGRVLAQVMGTEDYRTEITGRGKKIGGKCSCPAFEDRGLCKHMVAAVLAAKAAGCDTKAGDAGALARIRDHLKKKGVNALVEVIVGLAERYPVLFRKLDIAAAAVQADDETLKARFRKAIDGATRTRGFVDYRAAAGWAADVDATLDAVADLASGGRAGVALDLVERAIDRIERAIESMDDSDGHCIALLDRARDIHLAAARAAPPEPVQLARSLFDRETENGYGTFDRAVALYADVLGKEGLAEYRRLATEAWAKLPSRAAGARGRPELSDRGHRLRDILDFFAERDGDVDARIALRAKDLSSPWSYLQLAEFCLSQGRRQEALGHAEEGLWVFEDHRPDERLVHFAADLLAKADRRKDALLHLQKAFEKAPSLDLYARLCELGGKAAREHALNVLEVRLAKDERTRWHHPADLLVRILTREKSFDAAWSAAREHETSAGVREALARASEGSHPDEALKVYAERIERLANGGGNPAYAEAVALISHMGSLRGAAEQRTYVAALKERFGRKRNFMKLLE